MNLSKGMSQTLALIVAASVLMMTALTVIFLAQGSLTDLGSNTDRQSCLSAVRSQCSSRLPNAGGEDVTFTAPQQCITTDDQGNQILISGVGQGGTINDISYTFGTTTPGSGGTVPSVTCSTS